MIANELKTDNTFQPLGILTQQPLFSWKPEASGRAQRQTGYRILVDTDAERLARSVGSVWDSGKVASDETLQIRYSGNRLASGQRYYWKVMVWDGNDAASEWSAAAWFETGLLQPEEWLGKWIGGNSGYNPLEGCKWIWHALPAMADAQVVFRRTIRVPSRQALRQAIFHGTCGGAFTLFVNGSTVAKQNARWKQDWTSPFTYIDFTSKLGEGDNVLTCEAASTDGEQAGFIAAFELRYEDGSIELISTDAAWQASYKEAGGNEGQPAVIVAEYGDAPWGRIKRRGPAPLLRKEFAVEKQVKRARLHICCLGYFELRLNGKRLGDGLLQPDYTQFPKRTYALTFEGESFLTEGSNCVGVELGRGHYAYQKDWIGDVLSKPEPSTGTIEPKFLLQLQIEYADGTSGTIVSDETWRTADGPTRDDNIWYGDKYDARFEREGWDTAGFASGDWAPVNLMTPNEGAIEAAFVPPIRVVETVPFGLIGNPKPNVHVFDCGKVTAGWARLTLTAERGTSVKLIYDERLRDDGTLDIWKRGYDHQFWENAQEDVYVCKGGGEESWEPKFSYKGFRYIQIESSCDISRLKLEALVFHNDVEAIGSFECSNPLFNRIHRAMVDTMLNNFHSIPTDTPYHEKRGWLGDAQAIAECATMNLDLTAFFSKWVQDIADSQDEHGAVCHTAPGPFLYMTPTPAWMSAFIIIPWTLYEYYGDRETMRKHYAGMKRYLHYEWNRLVDGTSTDESYADWAVPGPFIGPEGGDLLATAYVFHSCTLMARIAEVLGEEADRAAYLAAEERLRTALHGKFYDADHQVYRTPIEAGYRQTSNVLPLAFGAVPAADVPRVIANLAADIRTRTNGHLDTGCFGTKYLAPVLTEHGLGELAYEIANKTTYPSWGYCLAVGGTSFWEAWEEETRSYDHYFLGTIDDWFYKHLAGIRTVSNGYRTSVIQPYALGDLTQVSGMIDTVRGRIGSKWEKTAGGFALAVTIPVNTTATVYVPKIGGGSLQESGVLAARAEGVFSVAEERDHWKIEAGSGTYRFESTN
ncbi:alpha-L-rhamnosidase [Paenibacillus glycinis]|uniref:alpha-L-rhamnosidase n=1 Tax=Paenibacillus glycinis TaxID=2697035 RepID=A0ABW9XI36_9BACL|nr:alpha-L-rhamnosidase [Paenibacillus glycinis]NBD22275.1 family 78 glycoside hydrolase catalytic domain [Paenibacillus glycinis]